jgi:hypothetical protein
MRWSSSDPRWPVAENGFYLTRSREGAEIKKEFHAESAENAEGVVGKKPD